MEFWLTQSSTYCMISANVPRFYPAYFTHYDTLSVLVISENLSIVNRFLQNYSEHNGFFSLSTASQETNYKIL